MSREPSNAPSLLSDQPLTPRGSQVTAPLNSGQHRRFYRFAVNPTGLSMGCR
jgi:hypothetical protein